MLWIHFAEIMQQSCTSTTETLQETIMWTVCQSWKMIRKQRQIFGQVEWCVWAERKSSIESWMVILPLSIAVIVRCDSMRFSIGRGRVGEQQLALKLEQFMRKSLTLWTPALKQMVCEPKYEITQIKSFLINKITNNLTLKRLQWHWWSVATGGWFTEFTRTHWFIDASNSTILSSITWRSKECSLG